MLKLDNLAFIVHMFQVSVQKTIKSYTRARQRRKKYTSLVDYIQLASAQH